MELLRQIALLDAGGTASSRQMAVQAATSASRLRTGDRPSSFTMIENRTGEKPADTGLKEAGRYWAERSRQILG
jgi:hypothetical protein